MGIVTNIGRLVRYVIKVMKKLKLKTTEAKIKRDAETKKKLRQEIEIEMERGKCISSTADLTKSSEDDRVFNTVGWEEAVTK